MSLTSLRFLGIPQLENASNNSPPMKRGSFGDGVRALQQALSDLGYSLPKSFASYGAPDGVFGGETKAAVIAFQESSTLTPDGKVGKNTMAELDSKFVREHEPPKLPEIGVVEYRIHGELLRVNQRHWLFGNSLCWAAALTMMYQWRDQMEHNTRDLLDQIGFKYRLLFEAGSMLPGYMWHDLIRNSDMDSFQLPSMTARDWEVLLRRHGMLWVGAMSGLGSGTFGHSFIMYGLTRGLHGNQHVLMINPDGARDWNIDFEDFTAAFEEASDPGYPQIRYFAYEG